MDSSDIEPIDRFKNDIRYRDKIVHVETIPSKKAKYKKIVNLNGRIIDYLESKDVKLYEHQAEAYEHIQNKENIIITTPTASGKTLAFNLPIMETMIEDEEATALYIYPAKALSNDQLHVLENLEEELDIKTNPRTYDGDTPKDERYGIRQKSRIVLTNPYQLHLILSWHHQWKRFYTQGGCWRSSIPPIMPTLSASKPCCTRCSAVWEKGCMLTLISIANAENIFLSETK